MKEQTPKEKAISVLEERCTPIKDDDGNEYFWTGNVAFVIDIALSELQKQHEAKIKEIREMIDRIALCQTSYSDICWDDGDIMFKITDTKAQGDWSQSEWNEKIKEFEKTYVDYKELIEEFDKIMRD